MKKFFGVRWLGFVVALVVAFSCQQKGTDYNEPAAFSLSGEPLFAKQPSEELYARLQEREDIYYATPDSAEAIIWYGRFLAYAGRYDDAINVFSQGVQKFPEDARFYRHRGHRYITIRKFDEAISDLEKATGLISGKENEIEPDGMPNAQNIPVSTLHGNIWYHLGLAYYLKHDFARSLTSFINCMRSGSNDDNIVSSTHWIYTIMCRINRDNDFNRILSRIRPEMNIIENTSYYRLCLLYKGEITVEEAQIDIEDGPSRDALDYGIARWYYCKGEEAIGKKFLDGILSQKNWASFGFIAAEADLFHK